MEQKKIDRINELARKAKSPAGLTPEEEAERALLRQEYIAACKSDPAAEEVIRSSRSRGSLTISPASGIILSILLCPARRLSYLFKEAPHGSY